jgi:AcrR family transcriptional regulator
LIESVSRELILDATERLLGRFGYSKMSMEDISKEAGLARRTLYVHFPGKEEVALATIDRIVDRLLARLEAISIEGGSPSERLRQMLLTRVLFRFDRVRDYYQGLDDLLGAIRPAYMQRRQRYFEAEARILVRVIEEGMKSGCIRKMDSFPAANAMLLATAALMPYSLSVRELGAREEVERRASAVIDLLLKGIQKVYK